MSGVGRFIRQLLVSAMLSAYAGWWSMLMLGIAHSTDDRVPAFGFWTCFWIASALSSVLTAHRITWEARGES